MKTKYGVKPRPSFEIIDWRGGTPSQPQQQIEQRADAEEDLPLDDEISF